jgi:hypothetical protein
MTDNQDLFNEFLATQLRSTSLTADKFKMALQDTIDQLQKGYKDAGRMYNVMFYTGIALIGIAVLFAFFKSSPLFTSIFAGMGALDILTFFLVNPVEKLQNSRAEYAKTAMLCFNWFTDTYNWNSWLMSKKDLTYEEFKKVSEKLSEITEKTIQAIDHNKQNTKEKYK